MFDSTRQQRHTLIPLDGTSPTGNCSPYLVMGAVMAEETMEVLQGTLDVLVLRALVVGVSHGYGVSRWIRERTGGTLSIDDAPLYKALHRLESAGWVSAEWGLSENNRRARYYRLTPQGRQQLKREEAAWRRYAQAVFMVLEPG